MAINCMARRPSWACCAPTHACCRLGWRRHEICKREAALHLVRAACAATLQRGRPGAGEPLA